MFNSQQKTVLITGGAQGIGKGLARHFAERGWTVALVDVDDEAGRETEAELESSTSARFIHADVSRPADATRAVRETVAAFSRLDLLVNNAGVFVPRPMEQMSPDDWLHVLGINLHGAFWFSREATPHLRATRGAIINIASTRAHMSEPHTEAYAASKGGLVALTHAMALSLGPEIRVNCISPGWIDVTNWKKRSVRSPAQLTAHDHAQHPAGRVGTPEDVASLAFWLAGPEAGFVTGQEFIVDGGMTRKMVYV